MSPAHPAELPPLPDGWKLHSVQIGGEIISLAGPADPDALLEAWDEEAERSGGSPYWGALWPAAIELAKTVGAVAASPPRRTIELGCGLGLVGIAALCAGHRVTFTDSVPQAVTTAAANARRNGYASVAAEVLNWLSPWEGAFDWVLAADVLYDRDLHLPLLKTVAGILGEGGECWIGDPGRSTLAEFISLSREQGFEVEVGAHEGSGAYRMIRLRFRRPHVGTNQQ